MSLGPPSRATGHDPLRSTSGQIDFWRLLFGIVGNFGNIWQNFNSFCKIRSLSGCPSGALLLPSFKTFWWIEWKKNGFIISMFWCNFSIGLVNFIRFWNVLQNLFYLLLILIEYKCRFNCRNTILLHGIKEK